MPDFSIAARTDAGGTCLYQVGWSSDSGGSSKPFGGKRGLLGTRRVSDRPWKHIASIDWGRREFKEGMRRQPEGTGIYWDNSKEESQGDYYHSPTVLSHKDKQQIPPALPSASAKRLIFINCLIKSNPPL